jgi:hypothetical protein
MNTENLGQPDLAFLGLRLWISARQFPDSKDYWDGNWVVVTACCTAPLSRVFAQGTFLHLPELAMWRDEIVKLHKKAEGTAELKCMEPNLEALVKLNSLGTGTVTICLTPDHMTQKHQVEFEVDQSYLPRVIEQIDSILEKFPIRK